MNVKLRKLAMIVAVAALASAGCAGALPVGRGGSAVPPELPSVIASPRTFEPSTFTSPPGPTAYDESPPLESGVEPSPPPLPTMPPFPGPPTLQSPETAATTSTDQGGCGAIFYLTEGVAGDQCGPHVFQLRDQAVRVRARERLTFMAPVGSMFSVVKMGGKEGWSVSIAPGSAISGLALGDQETLPAKASSVLARGLGPQQTIGVPAPAERGTYVVQLVAPLERDGWTFSGLIYFWRVDVI